ncbi:three-Cys-motif partner protein TcmP [Flavobacterium sp. RHBU_3]|uniref:three-Cys-motif partner protein TcmP n=1 Tax=Flavobacterium sp. RHBU_3 TaxID=3391184 RepID=UPI00398562AF
MAKDLFSKPFDEGTNAKLEIFKLYLREWLPVFISSYEKRFWSTIFIYDFFAGEGKDSIGNHGSPLVILDVLKEYEALVKQTKVKIKIIFNEKEKVSLDRLKANIKDFGYNEETVEIVYYNKPFQDFFKEIYPKMMLNTEYPRLMFLDQYGIKEITSEIFKKLISFKRTDFIFFISSSFIRRFKELDEFKNYISITKEKFDETKPFHSHRVVFDYYKSLISTDYMLAPFSIKKGINIYGLIFGSNHSLGLEKFLNVAWKINPHTGDANFNIDEENIIKGQVSLFEEDNKIKKISFYENELENLILSKKIVTLHKCYLYTLEYGCLPKHCNKVLVQLQKNNKIAALNTRSQKIHNLAPPNDANIVLI